MRFHWPYLLLFALLLLPSCRNSARAPQTSDLQINLVAPLFPTAVGEGVVKIQVLDADGQPVSDLNLSLRGDMTHAGMVPVLAQTGEVEEGIYTFPFDWTMAGDWVLTVDTETHSGQRLQQFFDIQVDGDIPVCNDETVTDLESQTSTP